MARGSGGMPRDSRGSLVYETLCWNLSLCRAISGFQSADVL